MRAIARTWDNRMYTGVIQRRAIAAGIETKVSYHSFRATVEKAQLVRPGSEMTAPQFEICLQVKGWKEAVLPASFVQAG